MGDNETIKVIKTTQIYFKVTTVMLGMHPNCIGVKYDISLLRVNYKKKNVIIIVLVGEFLQVAVTTIMMKTHRQTSYSPYNDTA